MDAYCTVRVKRFDGEDESVTEFRPASFEELLALLREVRDRHADEYADLVAGESRQSDGATRDVLGGFGVEVENRWGGVTEAALGRDACFLFRHLPRPGRCYSDRPAIEGTRVFYLDGGHHTELDAEELVSREGFRLALCRWLDEGVFPDRGPA